MNEPKKVKKHMLDPHWVVAMQEELSQYERNKLWKLVPRSHNMSVVGAKFVFRIKLDETGILVRNEARLVAKGYSQDEGIDYGETFTPFAILEAIRMP